MRSSLAALGDGNWKMGEGGVVKKVPTTGDDDQVLLEHYARTFYFPISFPVTDSPI